MRTLRIAPSVFLASVLTVALVATTTAATVSSADPITVTFTAYPAVTDPVNRGPSTGMFTFDSTLMPPGEGLLSSPHGLGTSVSFFWGNTSFDIVSANVAELRFDASGQLVHWLLGGFTGGLAAWIDRPIAAVVDDFVLAPGSFFYTLRGQEGTFQGTVRTDSPSAPVPEPSTMLLLSSGVVALMRRTRRPAACRKL